MKILCFDYMTLEEIETFMKAIDATGVHGTSDRHMRGVEHVEFVVGGIRYQLAGHGLKIQRGTGGDGK